MMKNSWPELKFQDLKDTLYTVQLWTQIVGKIRLKKTPWLNHSWHVALYVSPLGLTTGSVPYERGIFRIDFDFISHKLILQSTYKAAANTGNWDRQSLETDFSYYERKYQK